jgi:hypothetical protein
LADGAKNGLPQRRRGTESKKKKKQKKKHQREIIGLTD